MYMSTKDKREPKGFTKMLLVVLDCVVLTCCLPMKIFSTVAYTLLLYKFSERGNFH